MLFIKTTLFAIVICLTVMACNQSEDKEKQAEQNPTTTNAAETPLVIPETPPQTGSTNLQDIWVLDSINSKAPDSNYFAHGTPYFDFNVDKKTISGHTGCNALKGTLNVDGEKLKFDNLDVSKEVCSDKGFEKKLVSGFKSGNTTYTILNDKLQLNAGSDFLLIFRRIRR